MARPRHAGRARPQRTALLLVRHGESEDNVVGRLSGGRDVPLSATGRRQARRLAAFLAATFPVEAIYASPLRRAMETARRIGREIGLEPIASDGLSERRLGRLEGRMVSAYPPGEISAAIRRAGGETATAFCARVRRAMRQITRRHRGKTVVVVTHGGTLAAFLATALRRDPARWKEFVTDNATLTVVSTGKGGTTLDQFNARAPERPRAGAQ